MYHHGMYHAKNGFILITALMVMQILMLAAWIILANTCLLLKISRQLPLSHAMFVHAETALREVERQVLNGQLRLGCSGAFGEGEYICQTESLGMDPCMILSETGQSGEYIRLTFEWHEPSSALPVILQTVLLKSAAVAGKCHGNRHSMPGGRIAWREVDIS